MKENNANNPEIIKMVDYALKVLDFLREGNKCLGVNEIAKEEGISPSTTHRILKTLLINGWVYQLSDSRYIAGEKLSFVLENNNLYLAMKDYANLVMTRMTEKTNRAMNLCVRENEKCYILQQSRTNGLVDVVPPLYTVLPYNASGGGKVLLSEQPEIFLREFLLTYPMKKYTAETITNPSDYLEELKAVRKQGYALDLRESNENLSCVAVPVRDDKGSIMAALSFSGFINATPEELISYVPALQEASRKITDGLFQCKKDALLNTK